MLSWKSARIGIVLLGIALAILAGCDGPVPTRPVLAPTLPLSIMPAPGEVVWALDANLGAVTTLDGTLQPGQTATILAGIEAGLSPTSPTASSRQMVFALACDDPADAALRWWLEPASEEVAGCGESLAWTLSYATSRLRLGLALDVAASAPLGYHLTATAHSPY